jgi:hypothetical protein
MLTYIFVNISFHLYILYQFIWIDKKNMNSYVLLYNIFINSWIANYISIFIKGEKGTKTDLDIEIDSWDRIYRYIDIFMIWDRWISNCNINGQKNRMT